VCSRCSLRGKSFFAYGLLVVVGLFFCFGCLAFGWRAREDAKKPGKIFKCGVDILGKRKKEKIKYLKIKKKIVPAQAQSWGACLIGEPSLFLAFPLPFIY
jgi:hypothetical protein